MEAPCAKSNPRVYCIEEGCCKRSRVYASISSQMRLDEVPERVVCQYLFNADSAAVQSSNQMKFGVYIQVPFCQTKCTYCNFHTGVVARHRSEPYAAAVCSEITRVAAPMNSKIEEAGGDTVSFGGGISHLVGAVARKGMLDRLGDNIGFE